MVQLKVAGTVKVESLEGLGRATAVQSGDTSGIYTTSVASAGVQPIHFIPGEG
jgi:hypothetical protein